MSSFSLSTACSSVSPELDASDVSPGNIILPIGSVASAVASALTAHPRSIALAAENPIFLIKRKEMILPAATPASFFIRPKKKGIAPRLRLIIYKIDRSKRSKKKGMKRRATPGM